MTETISTATTKVEVISHAAMLCGKQSFNTLASGGAFAYDGEALFNALVSAELGSNRWRFSQDFKSISTLTTLTPSIDGYQYYFDLPNDCAMLFRLYPMIDYQVYGNRVLTKSNQSVQAVYSKTVAVSEWPPSFTMYIIYHLATLMAMSVTNSDRMVARINNGMNEWRSRALFSDGQNSKPTTMQNNTWINARFQFRNGGSR